MNIIQLNKFSNLHDGKRIFFCKTDFLQEEFKLINSIDGEVVLITGNSDYPITDTIFKSAPKNIKKWFAQNAITKNDIVEPIPLGIENRFESERVGHGIGYYDRVKIKEELLSIDNTSTPTKNIYSNFRIETNYPHRNEVKLICSELAHIDWEEPTLPLEVFFEKIKNYKSVVCPAGNGVDTHRLWEVLYSGRIPITIKMGNFKIYELYEKLPIIMLDNLHDLKNEEFLVNKIESIQQSEFNLDLLYFEYWKDKIISLV